jgi:predicted Zn finger-like uncharacterized protein
MVEIQCPSCQTRYRIDERVIPDEAPTFKCSRCGHVFTAEPRTPKASAAKPPSSKTVALRKRPQPRKPSPPEPEEVVPAEVAEDIAQSIAKVPNPVADPPKVEESRTPTEELLNRSFADAAEEAKPGENLTFEFSEESNEEHTASELAADTREAEEDRWEVGEGSEAMHFGAGAPEPTDLKKAEAEPTGIEGEAAARMARLRALSDDGETLPLGHPVHSAGFFLALFFFAALGFGAASLVICGAPSASASLLSRLPVVGERFANPVSPAILVALHDVHADYRQISGGKTALVITGQAQNVGNRPLHVVEVRATLLDPSQRGIAKQAVYCGNTLSSRMISEMTPREIEFFERLEPPTSFVVQPSATAPFVIVIVDPPRAGRFAISVAQAQRASSMPAARGTAAAQTPGA